jgi:hypothetical protein
VTNVPTLNPDDLSAELELIHRKEHRSFNTLVLARIQPMLAEVTVRTHKGLQCFRVEAAHSEIELRAALPDGPDDPPAVVLVDWEPGRLPADLLGRVANGTVYTIARARRLRASFSHAQIASEVEQCRPLADAILHEPQFRRPVPPGGLVTLDLAWRAWLLARKVFGEENEREVTLLLRFTRETPPTGLAPFLAQRPELQRELEAWLHHAIGPVAPWALRLWLDGKGSIAGALAFVLDGARDSLGAHDFVDGMLAARLGELSKPLADSARAEPRLLSAWADLANLLAAQCEDAPARLLQLLALADGFLPVHDAIATVLERSDYLRVALERRKLTLAEALEAAAGTPGDETRRAVIAALDVLGRHKMRETDAGQRELYERARMAARLIGWLSTRARDVAFSATESDIVVLTERAEDFVRQGGFADLARRIARGSAEDTLGAAIQRVVAQADAQRDRDDVEFAQKLVRWNELGRPADRVIPVEMALDSFAARFLKEDPQRRLLVLVLDGMSWDRAVELLEALEPAQYAPLRWRVPGSEHGGVPPVLAALPTITDVSRAALFAGQLLRPGEALDTSRDALRLQNHKALRALDVKAPLLVKRDLHTPAGDVSADALELVGRPERVVALVIDDNRETIRPLRDLLERATLANRAVLLVADHGHAPGARMERTVRRREDESGGMRWRTWHSGAAPDEGEVVLGGSYAWRPPGIERVALLARETESYGIATGDGEQGGATLAEVVAPAILLAAESLAERMRTAFECDNVDPALEVRPLVRPPWWSLRSDTAPSAPRAPTPAPRPVRKAPASAQPAFPQLAADLRPVPPTAAPPAPKASSWAAFFATSKALPKIGRRLDARFVAAVEALDGEGGTLSVERLAAGVDLLPSRIEGLVASMSEVLNADGTSVIQYDAATRLVRLDLAALKEIFG